MDGKKGKMEDAERTLNRSSLWGAQSRRRWEWGRNKYQAEGTSDVLLGKRSLGA